MQLFINKKEVPTLIKAIELLLTIEPQCSEAQVLLQRIYECLEKQGQDEYTEAAGYGCSAALQ